MLGASVEDLQKSNSSSAPSSSASPPPSPSSASLAKNQNTTHPQSGNTPNSSVTAALLWSPEAYPFSVEDSQGNCPCLWWMFVIHSGAIV
jgi:hypothetical protein